ncbi:unnamed protein product [Rhizoctonia solani]|uniref:GmrSD restriction endonucleases C-terminal domain-containing protein n=1 Tax=Rhizoctonia solani TaxID=456999 RepID=A0A8H3GAK1_9AGAM|nr:unnamed protein product [Rhizoctonia solani]
MHFTYLLVLAGLVSASPLHLDREIGRRGNLPTPVSVATAKTYLAELKVAAPVTDPPYDRNKFRHWITVEGKCDARETVIKRDATVEVTVDSQCRAIAGSWKSDYDDLMVASATMLDIDHIVPLKEAWQAGAWNWTQEMRRDFANDLVRPQLLAVSASSNRMKGDKDPSKWMPSSEAFHCKYVRAWIQVKRHYKLAVDQTEKEALEKYINNC